MNIALKGNMSSNNNSGKTETGDSIAWLQFIPMLTQMWYLFMQQVKGHPTFLHRHISYEHQLSMTPCQCHTKAAETQGRVKVTPNINMLPSSGQTLQLQLKVSGKRQQYIRFFHKNLLLYCLTLRQTILSHGAETDAESPVTCQVWSIYVAGCINKYHEW